MAEMKIAQAGGMSITGEGFKNALEQVVSQYSIHSIIETGTYLGMGSTRTLVELLNAKGVQYNLFTIEANPEFVEIAKKNLINFRNVNVINGYSIPKELIPTRAKTAQMLNELKHEDIFVDFKEYERLDWYEQDNKYNVPDDMLRVVLRFFGWRADLILLDSSGSMGWIEFSYILSMVQGPCVFVLDDTNHVKHFKSLRFIKESPDFKIIVESLEKFGFCIAEYKGKGKI